MRIIPFPERSDAGPDENWLCELEHALSGAGSDQRAESWRQLREQVRALAPPMSPEFEREIQGRIASWRRRPATGRLGRWQRWVLGRRLLASAAVAIVGVVIALALIGEPRTGTPAGNNSSSGVASFRASGSRGASRATTNDLLKGSTVGAAASAAAIPSARSEAGAALPPSRIQQLAASITLAPEPGELQETADRVSRLTVSYGGFVQSSHVNVAPSSGEANLTLSLPSTKLSAALAALADLAPVRAESQSLQDITSAYDTARQRLAEVRAEQRALLRALSRASTQGQIDSLRERLVQTRGAITQARSTLGTISRQAASAEVEVSVLANPHATSEGLTLKRGLHDASRVLTLVLIVLLISAAVLVPLLLLVLMLVSAHSVWRRYRRERALQND